MYSLRAHEPMEVILSERCCGKTSIRNGRYFDFDIFANVKPKSYSFLKELVSLYSTKHKGLIAWMNVNEFFRYGFDEMKEFSVTRVILPEMSVGNLSFRKRLFTERDMRIYGVVRKRQYEELEQKYRNAYSLVKSRFPHIKIETLREGEFLDDFFLR